MAASVSARRTLLGVALALVVSLGCTPGARANPDSAEVLATVEERGPLTVGSVPDILQPGQAMFSPTRQHVAVMQRDGNVVVYGLWGRALWATGTWGHPGARLELRTDGNIVVVSAAGEDLWQSGSRAPVRDQLIVGDDMLMLSPYGRWYVYLDDNVLTAPVTLHEGERLRRSLDHHQAVVQADGNVVLYDSDRGARWATGTEGNPGAYLALQSDGNLVVYSAAGKALWASGTFTSSATVVLTSATYPYLALRSGAGAELWTSG